MDVLAPPRRAGATRLSPRIALAIAGGMFVVWFLFAFSAKWHHFGFGYDLAYFTQAVRNLGHLRTQFVGFAGLPLLGDHAEISFLPMTVLGAGMMPAAWLAVVSGVSLAAAAVPVAWIAEQEGFTGAAPVALATGFLLHPALANLGLADFHPEVIVVPLWLFAVWAAREARWGVFAVCVAVALLTKEDQAAVAVALGLWLLLVRRERVAAVGTVTAGLLWGAVATGFVVPHFSPLGDYTRTGIFGSYGPTLVSAVPQMVLHPGRVLADVARPVNAGFLVHLLAPCAFLPLLAPEMLIPALPILLGDMLAVAPWPHTIDSQYHAAVVPFLAVATVVGARRLTRVVPGRAVVGAMVAAAVVGTLVLSEARPSLVLASPDRRSTQLAHAVSLPGSADGVVATHDIAAHLGDRDVLFPFPAPFAPSPGLIAARPGDETRVAWVLIGDDRWAMAPPQHQLLEDIARRCGFVLRWSDGGFEAWQRPVPAAPCS